MNSNSVSRRAALRMGLAVAVLPVLTACNTLKSLPRANATSQTDGNPLSLDVYNALKSSPLTVNLNLSVSSQGSEVIVKGTVSNRNDIASVEDVAGRVPGVSYVYADIFIN